MTSRSRRPSSLIPVALTLVMGLVAMSCGGGDDDEGAGGGGGGNGGDLSECPMDALDEASGPVEIRFWHAMTRANEEALIQLTDQYNASQDRVQVTLVNQTSYEDIQQLYLAGLETGELPDVVQHQDIFLQAMIDTQTVLPAESCIEATDLDTEDFVPRTLDYYSVEDVQWAMPFNVSNPVLLYNRTAFTAAGLDPDSPPQTLEDLRTAAEALRDVGGYEFGMGIKLDPWHLEQFLALQGETLVDNGNGRDARATEVTFDSEAGQEVFTFLADLVADGLATTTPREGPGQFDNLLGVGSERWGMTIDSSASLGTIFQLLQGGQYANVDPAVGPLPGRTEEGSVLVGGAGLYNVAQADEPAKQAAVWDYITYLTTPENQSFWSAATGYVPVRQSATELPEIQQRWAEIPGFRVAYDQLVQGAENDATAGAVIGDFRGVRSAVEEAENNMFLDGTDPAEALAEAAETANQVIQDYNDRIGA